MTPAKKILVVDDGADSRSSMATLLRLAGHLVDEAADGASAIQAARTFKPDVVILDIGMPGMSGFEVATRLRQLPETARSTLIALTGYGEPEMADRARQAGFDHHFVKPLHPMVLERLLAP